MSEDILIRPAADRDVPEICALLNQYADQGIVLRRSEEDIRFYLANFVVAECAGVLCGCAAGRDFGNDLIEVRSLAVLGAYHRRGIGKKLVEFIIQKQKSLRDHGKIFTLTYQTEFFQRWDFVLTSRHLFPEKIWADCSKCPKQQCCDEVAMLFEF